MNRRPTVLIVEDEVLIRDIVAMEFADAGFDVLEADDCSSAFAHLDTAAPIDLLFTDIRLPGDCSGWDIAQRARTGRPKLPVFYATGYSNEAPRLVAGSQFFRKPYRPLEVIDAARDLGIAP